MKHEHESISKNAHRKRPRRLRRWVWTVFPIVLVAGLFWLQVSGCRGGSRDGQIIPPSQTDAQKRDALIPVGQTAPDFAALDQNGREVRLSVLLADGPVVLIFYPANNTPTCTGQLCAVRDDWSAFQDRRATVLGINPAEVSRHADFAGKHRLPFPVLSDAGNAIADAYGVAGWLLNARTVYVIGPDRRVALAEHGVVPHERIFAALDTLSTATQPQSESTAGESTFASAGELRLVPAVDLDRFMGRWYEIARYPNIFQDGTVGVVAEYALRSDGVIAMTNTGRKGTLDGESVRSTARGYVVEGTANARWDVYFFPLLSAPYWIIDLGSNYEYAAVGQPSRDNLWILSRTPALPADVYAGILDRLGCQGYDPAKLVLTPQPAGDRAITQFPHPAIKQ